ncbi:hypothetical protein ACFSR7_29605 [Cohnella sp. GCM10020058]|uniref:hypothetical protein n=1 Tax=Cohnella sp. GCM10020058 TaxID=3317330 RepID=UPI003627CF5C
MSNNIAPATGKRLRRVTLEMSLKPFKRLDDASVEQTCAEALRQWAPLLQMADGASVLLWASDGSEILEWRGELSDRFEWGKYVGFANPEQFTHAQDKSAPHIAKPYIEEPPELTYADLQRIVAAFKRVAATRYGLPMEVGATFDAGPEFAYSDFKYSRHPEINLAELGGETLSLNAHYTVVCAWSKLMADRHAYAAYPDGIPEGTPFGTFLGKQCDSYLPAIGFDYIWFSNGFGVSYFPWTYLGAHYDGTTFGKADPAELSGKALSFWRAFKSECPSVRTEVRGTNYGTGMDLAKDCIPLRSLYEEGYVAYPPPNSPWGALNYDFGLELTGFLSRIAELPGDTYPFRFYANDPWFWQNPWRDYYDRQPHDIYIPLSAARVGRSGEMESAGIVEILTVDTERGELREEDPAEIIPHIRRAYEAAPDRPGLATWLYPFKELNALAADREASSRIFFHDWFIRNAINQGFPLNAVLGTDTLAGMDDEALAKLEDTVLVTSTAWLDARGTAVVRKLLARGAKLLLYGDAREPSLLELLNLRREQALEGDFELSHVFATDERDGLDGKAAQPPRRLRHRAEVGDGGLAQTPLDAADPHTRICAEAVGPEGNRVFALRRALPEWGGGAIAWVRGSLPFEAAGVTHLPKRQEAEWADASVLLRYMLQSFGYVLLQEKQDPASREALLLVSRKDGGYWFSGCNQDTTVRLKLRFPEGVPVPVGHTVAVGPGPGEFAGYRGFHDECRIFVAQSERSRVWCRENQPAPSRMMIAKRTLTVAGLRGADVSVCPPPEALASGRIEVKLNGAVTEIGEALASARGGVLRLGGVNGTLDVSW